MTDVMKEKLNPSLRSTEESMLNQNSFRVLSIVYCFSILSIYIYIIYMYPPGYHWLYGNSCTWTYDVPLW